MLLLAALLNVCAAMAVPAHKGTVKISQPDGTILTLRLVGDEWVHFNTTADGYSIVKNNKGYYVYAQKENGKLLPTSQVAHDAAVRTASEKEFLSNIEKYQAPDMQESVSYLKAHREKAMAKARTARKEGRYDYSNFRGLLILVEFNDKPFSRDDYKDIINDMVNMEDYTGYVGTNGRKVQFPGSVRDYFSDQSDGQFKPEFDVYGPFQIDYSQYDAGGSSFAPQVINAAVEAADAEVDFSQYDRDGDEVVDMIYFIFAGNGANYGGNDSRLFWPHRSIIYDPSTYSYVNKDGVTLYDYASSVELYGYTSYPQSVTIDGIGTICHEFGHVLGLPDFYDTDYEQNGQSNDPGEWSVMAGGSYNNYGRNPIGYSIFERYMVGFATPETIDAEGSYTLNNVQTSNTGYRINSSQDKEYFMLENRQQDNKWNLYAPGHGMLVFRVDSTNTRAWRNNVVNANPKHNFYEMVRADGYHNGGSTSDPFPGTSRVTELNNITTPANLITWTGKQTKWGLSNIRESKGVISFDIENTFILKGITVDEEMTIGVSVTRQLIAKADPEYLTFEATWSSSDEAIATVDAEGRVTGIAPGQCVVTVTTTDGMFSASCTVNVEEQMIVENISEFKSLEDGGKCLLKFADAEVLFVNKEDVFVRDASGAVILSGIGIATSQNDVINGTLFLEKGTRDNMPIATLVEGRTDITSVTTKKGSKVKPREVTLDEITHDDYADYLHVKTVELVLDGGIYAVDGNHRIRLYNTFGIKKLVVPTSLDNKRFNITCIYGTNTLDNEVIDEFYLLASPEEDKTWVPEPPATIVKDIAELKTLESETLATLKLTDAQVLMADNEEGDVIIRDHSGALSLYLEGFETKVGDILNGEVTGLYSAEDGMAFLDDEQSRTDIAAITVTEGEEPQPMTVTYDDLLSLDTNEKLLASPLTSNLVKIEKVSLSPFMMMFYKMTGENGEQGLYFANIFEDPSIVIPKTVTGKTFDVEGLFGHMVDEDADIDMLMLVPTKSPEEVIVEGIVDLQGTSADGAAAYNLAGQRVGAAYKGIVIRNGKKSIK